MRNSWLLIFICLPLLLKAQQATLSGKITDEAGAPIPYANLYIQSLKTGTSSDDRGNYTIEEIPYGDYQLEVSSIGYQRVSIPISIQQSPVIRNISLQSTSENIAAVEVLGREEQNSSYARLKNIDGVAIYAAKKNEVIELENMVANLASNNARQIFAKVPGVNVWESDCAGLQLGIGARGLSPDRSSNFNTRQNGYDMAADALGYPESYYAPPMQAIERIEVVRGAASLQYGTQFGGMINLKLKKGDPDQKLSGETVNTYNSLGYFNTYNEIGGQNGKLNYFAFLNYRGGDCATENSDFNTYTGHLRLGYQASEKLEVIGEYTRMQYLAQQPGGLTDQQYAADPYQSLRSRNWFAVDWNLMALHLNYRLSDQTQLNSRNFALVGSRKALGVLSQPDRLDLEPYLPRDLLADDYANIGNETRLLHRYRLGDQPSAFLIGGRAYRGFTQKTQGFGSRGSDADFNFYSDSLKLRSDYSFPSYNLAAFVENVFNLNDRLSITPGLRYDYIVTTADGFYDSSTRIPNTGEIIIDSTTYEYRQRPRSILLGGIGMAYKLNEKLEVYTNFSQNYRAITFNNIRVVNPSVEVDPNLKDEKGFNADLGLRGNLSEAISIDLGFFYLSYRDRIGSYQDRLKRVTTNIGDARIFGFEGFAEVDWLAFRPNNTALRLSSFVNLALTDAHYTNGIESVYNGKRVENVPVTNFKFGIEAGYKNFNLAWQFGYLSQQFTEATNALRSPNGIYGEIPAYRVMDLSADYSYRFLKVEAGINNLSNAVYFTRRATGYPGPGIIVSAPRHFYLGLALSF